MNLPPIDPMIAAGAVLSTAVTDAVYVLFNSAVSARRRFAAASLSRFWRLLADQLHVELGLCAVGRARLLDRRVPVDHRARPRLAAAEVSRGERYMIYFSYCS